MKIILLFTIIFLLLAAFAIITSGSGEEEQKEVLLCQYMETHNDVMEWADIYICEFLSDMTKCADIL